MSWMAVAKKEYLENVRNAWVITVSVVFLTLVLLTSWLVDAFTAGAPPDATGAFNRVVLTLSVMHGFGSFLPPILALMLGFATLAGERESGSLGLLTAQPLSRGEIVLGKWLGLWGVLATAVLLGFGLGGLIVLTRSSAGSVGAQALGLFLLVTLAWCAAWTSVTVLVSSFFQRRGTAIAGSIGIWFLFGSFVWTLLNFALSGVAMDAGRFQEPPEWLVYVQLFNPNQVYDALLAAGIEGFGVSFDVTGMLQGALRDMYTVGIFAVAMVGWIALPAAGALALFRRRDI